MQKEQLLIAISRLDNILKTVHQQNSGCDIHCIGNIRNTATMLREQLIKDPECMEDELVLQIINNTEQKVVEFFKKKYFPNLP